MKFKYDAFSLIQIPENDFNLTLLTCDTTQEKVVTTSYVL